MKSVRLPVLMPPLPEQRYSCHGCGDCCRDFTVQLTEDDLAKLDAQGWEQTLGESPVVRFRGAAYLRQRDDGACVFLQDDGLCRIHAEHGFAEKPLACQVFPFAFAPDSKNLRIGLSFACRSVQENKGAALPSHRADVDRFVRERPGVARAAADAPLAADADSASRVEIDGLNRILGAWLARSDIELPVRLDGFAWLAQSLGDATYREVREQRFVELVDLLVSALPDELKLLPFDDASARQRKLLRQAVFARTEDPRLADAAARSRTSAVLSQLRRSRAFASGRGTTPRLGPMLPEGVPFAMIDGCARLHESPDAAAIDDLVVRWLRALLRAGRAWGSGHYGWSVVDGMQATSVHLASAGWLARMLAASEGAPTPTIEHARRAIGRVDRHVGRAPWLGSAAERMRLRYLRIDDGLRRVVANGW